MILHFIIRRNYHRKDVKEHKKNPGTLHATRIFYAIKFLIQYVIAFGGEGFAD